MSELCIAVEAEPADLKWYLDLTNGNVILVSHEYSASENGGITAVQLEQTADRFTLVPAATAADGVSDMTAFAAQLTDLRLKESLDLALSAPKPERRFRAALGWLPEELERWHSFRQSRCEQRARVWLTSIGIAPGQRG